MYGAESSNSFDWIGTMGSREKHDYLPRFDVRRSQVSIMRSISHKRNAKASFPFAFRSVLFARNRGPQHRHSPTTRTNERMRERSIQKPIHSRETRLAHTERQTPTGDGHRIHNKPKQSQAHTWYIFKNFGSVSVAVCMRSWLVGDVSTKNRCV